MRLQSINIRSLITMILFVSSAMSSKAQSGSESTERTLKVPDKTLGILEAIYEGNEFSVKSFNADWLPDGSGYLRLEASSGDKYNSLVSYDVQSGERSELVSSMQLISSVAEGPATISSYLFAPDGSSVLLEAEMKTEDGSETVFWMLERSSGKLSKVEAGRNNSISPDGKSILYSDGGNLFVYELPAEATTQLTVDAVPGSVSYGSAIWSPDGKSIAFVQSDVTRVKLRSALIPGDPSYPGVSERRFARVGGTIATLRVGVIDATGQEIRWLPVPIPSEGHYIGQIAWTGKSDELLVEKHSRFRDKRELLMANVKTGEIVRIFEESDPQWVISSFGFNTGVEWFDNFNKFLLVSEKEGWRQAYVYTREGQFKTKITPGNYDIIDRVRMDVSHGYYYFNASPENATQKYLYRARLDGKGDVERITPEDYSGTNTYNISPDAQWAFHTYSSAKEPPVTTLVKLPEHRLVRVLEDNNELRAKMDKMPGQDKEFLQLDIGNGVVMDCWMIKPKDFDPTKKYPVFAYVYGEPHGQTVMDSWGHASALFHSAIADLGYLVISIDNRGTRCPKGAAWRRAINGRLGPLSTKEQAAGIRELARMRPYVDLSRVGTWGWSGGGSNTLNAMFREPDLFKLGIAVAPKPQAHLYNAWFQEIYMKTPEVNREGYQQSSPINFAEGLEGHLLIVHGTGETNTHLQITEGLVDRLIELGKQFDYMTYPNRDHGIREGQGTSLHLRVLMARYLINHLPAGPSY